MIEALMDGLWPVVLVMSVGLNVALGFTVAGLMVWVCVLWDKVEDRG